MKILVITEYYPVVYKPYFDTQFADLLERGHELSIYAARPLDDVRNEKVRRYRLEDRTRYYPATLRDIPRTAGEIVRRVVRDPLRTLRGALASSEGTVRFRMAAAMRRMCVSEANVDFCLVHGLGAAVQFPGVQQLFRGVPLAMYFHGGEVPQTNLWSAEESERAFGMFDVVFTNTRYSRDRAVERGCDPAKVEVLPVGFDPGDYTPAEPRRYRRGGGLSLVSAGRMSEEKGFIYALEAVARLVGNGFTNIHYALAGEGYGRKPLEHFVKQHGLEKNVEFLGALNTVELAAAMGRADALILPSVQLGRWSETQACAVQEAMLMKAAVLSSRTGGVPESIPPEMAAFSFAERDVDGIVEAIRRLAELTDDDLVRLGDAGRRYVVENYEVGRLNEALIDRSMKRWLSKNAAAAQIEHAQPHRI